MRLSPSVIIIITFLLISSHSLAQCFMTGLFINTSACDPVTNTYTTTGTVQFVNAPTTGQLIVEDCNGVQQVLSPPFTSPTNFALAGQNADGAACSITAYFTADPTCTINLAYTAPICPCNIDNFSVNIGGCNGVTNTYTLSGDITYSTPPTGGTLVIQVNNGTTTYDTIINPPFTSPDTWSISGIPANGAGSTVTATFTNDAGCTSTINFTAPADCSCAADIGTFSVATTGQQNGNDITLCFGETVSLTANGDFVPPTEATNPPGPAYDPGIGWLIYSCPPTVGLTPDPLNPVPTDPCFVSWVTGPNFNDINDLFWVNAFGPNVFTDNTIYWVPITFYSLSSGTYSYVNTNVPCYELGPAFAIQYLPAVNQASVEDCVAGTVTTTISGGLPEIDGSNFTGQNLTPATASFAQASAPNGGNIIVSGLQDGDVYSFDIVDGNGCQVTITGTFVGLEDPAFSYPNAAVCADAGNQTPTITGDPGGTFTSTPAGLSINPATGLINVGASTPGQTYTVTYTTPDPICNASATFDITINPLPTVDGNDETICAGDAVTLNGTGADTYTWTGGVVDGVAFNPGATATYTVTGTITATGCSNTGTATVTVNPLPTVGAGPDQSVCTGTQVTLSGTGAATYAWDNGITNGIAFTPPAGTTTYTVTGTDANGCQNTDQVDVTVNPNPTVNAGPDQTVCEGTQVTLNGTGAATYAWNNGVTNGVAFTPAVGTTTYTVTGTDANGCTGTDQVDVTVNPLPTINAGPDQTVCEGTQVTLAGVGAATYAWDNGVTDGVAFTPAVGTITYTVTGTDANGCQNTDQVDVTVNPNPTVNAGPDQTVCPGVMVTLSGSGANTYAWDNGIANGVAFQPPAGTTTYTVTGTDANGCTNTDQVDVTVTTNITVDAGPDQTVCDGTQVTLTGSGAPILNWDNGITDGVAFTPPVGTTTYTVTGTDGNGCSGTDQVDVTVNPLPNVNAGPDQTICNNVQATLTGSGAATYAWDNGVMDGVAFTPPAGTTTYTVTGTDANGCVNTDQVDINVSTPPVVNAGPDQSVCQGVNVTLTASGAVTYAWDNGVTDGVAFTPPVGTTTYTVTGTDALGCTNTDQVDVTVNPLPIVDAGPDQTICDGINVTLAASGAATYIWDNGITDGVAFTPTIGTTTYTVTGTDANGCTNTDQVNVTSNPLPAVNAGVDQAVCENVQVTLSGTGAATYAWTNGVTNGVAFIPAIGTTTYTVTGTDANGCQNTDQVDVTVNPLPTVNAGPDQTLCEGGMVTLAATGTATNYTWNGGVVDGTPFTPTVGTNSYTVTGTDANGCQATDQVDVIVNPLPTVDAGSDQTICEGQTLVLTGSGALVYAWDNGVTDGVGFVPPVGTTTYTVTGTDANGCLNTDQVTITVEALPVVSFTGDNLSGCEPLTVTFTNTTPGNLTNCVWTFGDGTTMTGCGTVTTTYSNPGTYDVTLTTTTANGCSNSATYTNYIYVEANAIAAFQASPTVLSMFDTEVNFTNNSQNATNYDWSFGDGNSSTQVNPTHEYPVEQAGGYTVQLIANTPLGCADTATAVITVNEEVIFYVPNTFTPDDDQHNQTFKPVFTSGYDPFDFNLLIFNRWGEIVWESNDASVGWDGTYNGSLVQDGVYVWKIEFKTTLSDERQVVTGHVNLLR